MSIDIKNSEETKKRKMSTFSHRRRRNSLKKQEQVFILGLGKLYNLLLVVSNPHITLLSKLVSQRENIGTSSCSYSCSWNILLKRIQNKIVPVPATSVLRP